MKMDEEIVVSYLLIEFFPPGKNKKKKNPKHKKRVNNY
jgi:hypothetical protein